MDLIKLRGRARAMMSIGATAAFIGIAIMVHGEVNFGDAVLVGGIVLFIVGVILLAQTPTGDQDAG